MRPCQSPSARIDPRDLAGLCGLIGPMVQSQVSREIGKKFAGFSSFGGSLRFMAGFLD
jgi:hypothetical protein